MVPWNRGGCRPPCEEGTRHRLVGPTFFRTAPLLRRRGRCRRSDALVCRTSTRAENYSSGKTVRRSLANGGSSFRIERVQTDGDLSDKELAGSRYRLVKYHVVVSCSIVSYRVISCHIVSYRVIYQAPTSFKTPPSPHRLFDLQDSLHKLVHVLPQLLYFVPFSNVFYRFRAQTD